MISDPSNETLIKPPIQTISAGKIFRPSSALRNKLWLNTITMALFLYGIVAGSSGGILFLVLSDEVLPSDLFQQLFVQQMGLISCILLIFTAFWLIPAILLIPIYIHRIEYAVRSETGESLPEIYMKKGLLNVTKKHIPFRTITNISSRAGPFDRLFGIGNVQIETAGYSGQQAGPEVTLEGIAFYEEVRDFILTELRKFKSPYTTTTESPLPVSSSKEPLEDSQEIIQLLREIRDLLKSRN